MLHPHREPGLRPGAGGRLSGGFTLIELLVVLAIMAILSAMLMPSLSTVTDRSRVLECRSNLSHIALALRAYHADYGQYPPRLDSLATDQYVTDPAFLRCSHTGAGYYYRKPVGMKQRDILAACVDPATPSGQCPHGQRTSFVALERGGGLQEIHR